jgi:hypothetical protein
MTNNTKGEARRGNRKGRPAYLQGEETRRITVALSLGHIEIAQAIGSGSTTQGIRQALEYIAKESIKC